MTDAGITQVVERAMVHRTKQIRANAPLKGQTLPGVVRISEG
jgi:hypothetical protein